MIFNLRKPPAEKTVYHVAIIGGGFSGTLALANLVRAQEGPLAIDWFEETGIFGKGVAYSTQDTSHLLNVRADRMGAFADAPDGFYRWSQTAEGKNHTQRLWAGHSVEPDGFAPRALYCIYLESVLDAALKQAASKAIAIHMIPGKVVDATLRDAQTGQLTLAVEQAGALTHLPADALVLATGNLPPRRFRFQPGLVRGMQHYVANVWQKGKDHIFPEKVNQLSADDEIVIIGTGLTMVDSVLTLKKHGYKGIITAISRNGWLPAVHTATQPYPAWQWTQDPASIPTRVLPLVKRLREEIAVAAQNGFDWRSVIDSLRPVTQTLWQRLSIAEKRKGVKLFTLWNIHRHRMAPEIHADLKAMRESGTLKVVPGKIYYVGSDELGLTVAYRKRGANRIETIRACLVLNCTGPEYDIAASTHTLLRNMRDHGLITVGPLRIGIDINAKGGAKGLASDAIFPIGTLLIGELLECTAVPELRTQAAHIAVNVAARLKQLQEISRNAHLLHGAWI